MPKTITDREKAVEYLKQFTQNKEKYEKDLTNWTDEELAEHYKELETYYGRSIRTDNLMGRFNDKNHIYYWHNIDENNPALLEKRLAIGYSMVHADDAPGMKRSQDASRLGNSTVIQDVKNGVKAVLLRIPTNLYDLNQKVKQLQSNKKALFDHNGNPLKITTKSNDQAVVTHIDAGLTNPFEVDNAQLK